MKWLISSWKGLNPNYDEACLSANTINWVRVSLMAKDLVLYATARTMATKPVKSGNNAANDCCNHTLPMNLTKTTSPEAERRRRQGSARLTKQQFY